MSDDRLQLSNTAGNGKMWLPILDDHPDFLDDEEDGILKLPTAEGVIVLLWPDKERYDQIETQFPDEDWPVAEDDDSIQTVLAGRFQEFL